MLKKLFVPFLFLSLLSTVFAVDLKGRFGFGAGWTISSSTEKSSLLSPTLVMTKIGLAPRIAIEPTFQIMSVSNDVKASAFILQGLFDYVLLEHEKTNIAPKVGFSFATASEEWEEGKREFSQFGIPLGIGLEHWISEHFAIDLTTMSGFFSQSEPYKATTFTLGNATLNVCLLWYY